MTFDIYRSADTQSGQGNGISEYKVGQIVIDLNDAAKDQNTIELTEAGNDYGKFTITDEFNENPGRNQAVNYTVAFTYDGIAATPAIHMTLHDYQTLNNLRLSRKLTADKTNSRAIQCGRLRLCGIVMKYVL